MGRRWLGLCDDFGVVGVEEDFSLGGVQGTWVGLGCGPGDLVGVVEEHPKVAQSSNAGFRAYCWLSDFQPWIAQCAFLGFAAVMVEEHLLVRAAGHTHAPAATMVLVDKDDSILGTLVDRPGWAGRNTCWVEAVFADARQIEHE